MLWNIITDFGDSAAMLPAAALLAGWLLVDGQRRAALLWLTLFAGQAVLVAATKIAFRGWGVGIEALDFTGISGHSALACSVIPIGFALAAQRAGRTARLGAAAAGFAGGLAIGVSRVALAQHSWSEVAAGCALGASVALLFIGLVVEARFGKLFSGSGELSSGCGPTGDSRSAARVPAPVVAGALMAVVLLMHGTRAPSERVITKIALHLSGHSVPYTRAYYRDPWIHEFWLHDAWHRRVRGLADDAAASPVEPFGHVAEGMMAFAFSPSPRPPARGQST